MTTYSGLGWLRLLKSVSPEHQKFIIISSHWNDIAQRCTSAEQFEELWKIYSSHLPMIEPLNVDGEQNVVAEPKKLNDDVASILEEKYGKEELLDEMTESESE